MFLPQNKAPNIHVNINAYEMYDNKIKDFQQTADNVIVSAFPSTSKGFHIFIKFYPIKMEYFSMIKLQFILYSHYCRQIAKLI